MQVVDTDAAQVDDTNPEINLQLVFYDWNQTCSIWAELVGIN